MLQRGAGSNPQVLRHRRCQVLQVVYLYHAEAGTFLPIPDMPADLPAQIAAAGQALQKIDTGDPP